MAQCKPRICQKWVVEETPEGFKRDVLNWYLDSCGATLFPIRTIQDIGRIRPDLILVNDGTEGAMPRTPANVSQQMWPRPVTIHECLRRDVHLH